jgi:hypothetical protein
MDTTPPPDEGTAAASQVSGDDKEPKVDGDIPQSSPAAATSATSSSTSPQRKHTTSSSKPKGSEVRPAEKDGALETMRREWETRFAKMEADLADSRASQQKFQATTEAKIVAISTNLSEHAEQVSVAFGNATARSSALENMMAQLLAQQKTTNDSLAALTSDKRRKTDEKEEEGK